MLKYRLHLETSSSADGHEGIASTNKYWIKAFRNALSDAFASYEITSERSLNAMSLETLEDMLHSVTHRALGKPAMFPCLFADHFMRRSV